MLKYATSVETRVTESYIYVEFPDLMFLGSFCIQVVAKVRMTTLSQFCWPWPSRCLEDGKCVMSTPWEDLFVPGTLGGPEPHAAAGIFYR